MRSPHEIRRQSQASRTPPHEMCGASQALRILSMKLPRRLRLCRLAEICGTSEALRAPPGGLCETSGVFVHFVREICTTAQALCTLQMQFVERLTLCASPACFFGSVSGPVRPHHELRGICGTSQALRTLATNCA